MLSRWLFSLLCLFAWLVKTRPLEKYGLICVVFLSPDSHIRMCPSRGHGFCTVIWSQNGLSIKTLPILVWNWVRFLRTERILLFQFQRNQKERVMCKFKMGFKKPSCLISRKWWPYFYLPGLKTGMDLRGRVWKWVWKITFFALKYWSGFEEPLYKPSSKIPGNTPQVFELKLLKINGC